MAQNVTIAGASYLGVPRIEMPKTGGGTAVFVDTSDANAAAGDITKGKTAYVGGTKITGTLEASSVSVQDTKAVTITSNGTVSVTPDVPYDALKKVDVTVDVASGGGTSTVTFTKDGVGANIYYLDLDGVWRNERITTSVKTITIRQYAPFLLSSMFMNQGLYNVNNLEEAIMDSTIIINNYTTKIYYATASVASATLPSD